MMPKDERNRAVELLQSVDPRLLEELPQAFDENTIRIERLPLELIRPDPVQPRRVLPERIHFEFHGQRLTPHQALRELVQIAQIAARQNGRPFTSVLDLLPNADVFRQVKENTPRHGLNAAADGSKVAWRLAGMKTCTDLGLRIIPLRVCPI